METNAGKLICIPKKNLPTLTSSPIRNGLLTLTTLKSKQKILISKYIKQRKKKFWHLKTTKATHVLRKIQWKKQKKKPAFSWHSQRFQAHNTTFRMTHHKSLKASTKCAITTQQWLLLYVIKTCALARTKLQTSLKYYYDQKIISFETKFWE